MFCFTNEKRIVGYVTNETIMTEEGDSSFYQCDIAKEGAAPLKKPVDHVSIRFWNDMAVEFAARCKKGDFVTVFGTSRENQGHIVIVCKKFDTPTKSIENKNVHSNGQNALLKMSTRMDKMRNAKV